MSRAIALSPARPSARTRETVMSVSGATFLRVLDLEATYEDVILALRGVSLEVEEGAIVALLGPNGAGKTTTLKAISNLIRMEPRLTRPRSALIKFEIALSVV